MDGKGREDLMHTVYTHTVCNVIDSVQASNPGSLHGWEGKRESDAYTHSV